VIFDLRGREGGEERKKSIPVTGCRGLYGYDTSRILYFLNNWLTDGGKVVILMRLLHSTTQKHYFSASADRGVSRSQRGGSPMAIILVFRLELLLFISSSSSVVLTRPSGSCPTASQKIWYRRELNMDLWVCS
jgi:hypothetical protein